MNIWKNIRFTKFFISYVISNLGDWFDIFALQIIFVYEWNASPVLLGTLILFYFLPSIFLSPLAGVLADRTSKRNLMISTDILSTIFTLGLYFSGNIFEALLILFIRSCIFSLNTPAQQAYIKHVVSDNLLLKATSYTTIVFQMCKILGPMLGSVLLIYLSARACLIINAISFVISALMLLGLPKDDFEKEMHKKSNHWLKNVGIGINYIWKTPLIRITVIVVVIWFFCSLIRQSQMAFFLKHIFPNKKNTLGIYMSLDGLGAVITSMLLSRKKTSVKNYGYYYFLGFFLLSIGILGVAIYQSIWSIYFFYASALTAGLGTGIQIVNYNYIIKKATPQNLIGCVTGITIALQNIAQTIATFSSGFFVLWIGIREVYIGIAIVMLILGICSIIFYNQKYGSI